MVQSCPAVDIFRTLSSSPAVPGAGTNPALLLHYLMKALQRIRIN
jgi:hypothetical protein